ncbi:MAG: enoyl-CoA hydratase-related protein, partial [Sciscionella sp.]
QALSARERRARYRKGAALALGVAELGIPVVAAVNGAAAGAGLDLALCADLCLAARSASFVSGFVAVGLVPDLGGSWLLPRVVGLSRARRLVLGGERLDAETACEWGIAARVVDDDCLIDEAVATATGIAAQGCRPAYAEAKRALLDSTWSFAESLEQAATTQSLLMDTPEHRQRSRTILARTR